jgi:hypothetical protein
MHQETLGHGLRNFDAWRCLACGEIVDPVIMANRARTAAEDPHEDGYDDTPRQCKGTHSAGKQCEAVLRGGEEYCLTCLSAGQAGGKPTVSLAKFARILGTPKEATIENIDHREARRVAKQCNGKLTNGKRCQTRIPKSQEMCSRHRESEPKKADPIVGAMFEQRVYKQSPAGELAQAGTIQSIQENTVNDQKPPTGALARLIKPITPALPLPATSIILNFTQEQFDAIQGEKITTEEIRDLVMLAVAGELGRIVTTMDPMEKQKTALVGLKQANEGLTTLAA